ncbi:rhophilin-1-like [Sinocyclocheilus anshuiensis]|uniref:rhophilin-1-like n=1 Tax=Sinocyclocheilus anshuiensis TaxID=1608454 RepID=UPI0007B9C0F8|nr:PREDICTED: rhophilin-1-like [Sinocyclocheilus anshuiensis]
MEAGCDPLISTQRSKLQQRRAKLNQQINRELRLRTGAENLYREIVSVPMIPLGLKETKEIDMTVPLQDFISEHYGEDASLYLNEIRDFMELRQAMRTPSRNETGQELLMEYYNQLYFLDQRFFSPHRSLGIHFHWYDSLTGVPSVQRELAFEKGSVLFNIGSLYTQIGARQDRSTLTGIQSAIDAFQRAAGVFLYLQENFSHAPSLDMSSPALSILVRLMVAQVQECVCEKVIINMQDNNMNVLLQAAKEAARVSDVYSLVLQAMSVPLLKDYVPFSWISMVQVKTHHFRALAHYYTAAALCDSSGMPDEDDDEGREIKALIQIHTRRPDKLDLQDPEHKRRLGKAHLRKAIVRHEEALRLHAEVVHALKSCTERGPELDVITLQSHEVERRTNVSPTGEKECQSGSQRKAGREYERGSSSLWNWSLRSGGVTKRLGSTFSLSFGNFRESESMF